MAKNLVFYFSGTGNSYYVAKTISQEFNADLYSFASIKNGDAIDASLVVFVFPVYDFKPPKIVTEIISSLTYIHASKVIAIATYGVALSSALIHFEKTLLKIGVKLSQGHGIKLPHNAVGSIGINKSTNDALIEDADHKIRLILSDIENLSSKKIDMKSVFEAMPFLKQIPQVIKLIGILVFKGSSSLAFNATEECIECHLCQNICPVGNIVWDSNKPKFGSRCTGCFACLQWCPQTAIHLGAYQMSELGIKHYHHPKVKALDLLNTHTDK